MTPVKEEVWGLDDNRIPDMKMMLVSEDVKLEVDYVLEDVYEDYIRLINDPTYMKVDYNEKY